jgi:prephenate dehydrogenase
VSAERLGIAGLGLIGGSIALRARAGGTVTIGFDRDAAVALRARARGALSEVAPDFASLVTSCDTLVIAVPVDATHTLLRELVALARDPSRTMPSLTIDVASVKVPFAGVPTDLPSFIGTHPMAGREVGGIDAADGALFEAATWAFVPQRDAARTQRIRSFIERFGARPLAIEPEAHDAIVALTSHLPQALSVTLGSQLAARAGADPRVAQLCGPGMRSMLRLARSPGEIWAPIAQANARGLAAELRTFATLLHGVADHLEQGDISPLMSYFGDARRIAASLDPPSR